MSAAVSAGARTLAQVCRTTNAGVDCGACVFSVRRVMTEQLQRAAGPVMAASSA